MEYLLILLAAATGALLSVEAKIPDYIKVCKQNNPNMDQCVKNSIYDLREILATGIPELAVPPLDPLYFDKVDVELGTGLKAEISDLSLKGLHSFAIDDVHVNLGQDIYTINISVPEVTIHGTYKMDAKLAGIPLKGTGPIYFAPKLITGWGKLHGKKIKRTGKTLYYFPSMDFHLNIPDYEIRLENLFKEEPAIGEVTNRLLNEEKTEVMGSLLPGLEKAIVEKILSIGNNICKHFTWEELFPES